MPKNQSEVFRCGLGTPKFKFEAVQSRKLNFVAETSCIQCGRRGQVSLGTIMATFRIGNEFVGVCCDECLTPESYAEVLRRRELKQEAKPLSS